MYAIKESSNGHETERSMSSTTVYKSSEAMVARVRLSVMAHEIIADAIVQIAKAEAHAGQLHAETYKMHLTASLAHLEAVQTLVFEAKAKIKEAMEERPIEEGGEL